MSSSRLHIFCITNELLQWITLLSERYQLTAIWFSLEDDYAKTFKLPVNEIPSNCFQIYLFPNVFLKNKRIKYSSIDRYSGGIQIKPGRFIEHNGRSILLMTEINSSDSDDKVICLSKAVNWLKKQIKSTEFSGVIGKNSVTGGTSEYSNILYTSKAKKFFTAGAIWKQEITFNSEFVPKQG
ncbi:hypothetical protein ACVXLA_003825 [Escherichia coli]|uniref:hypothetical protein n=1 Tax=Escherichia coli TaxID=562 RepID=UPI002023AEC0|nr:hypothetical protein [Escherichia coli]